MKMVMFGMSSYPGGIENYIVNYFCHKNFPSDRFPTDFITYEESIAYEDLLKKKGYRICHVPHLKKNPLGYYKAVKSILKQNNYDIMYVNMLTAANALPVFLWESSKKRKLILHAHASSSTSGIIRRVFHMVHKSYCSKKATLRLSCSEKAGEWLFGGDKVFFVIPNAIDCDKFRPSDENRKIIREKFGVSEQTFLIGHIGRFAEEKNHSFMIEILQALLADHIEAKIMFVGDGYTREAVEQQVMEQGLCDRVIFAGTTSETERYYPAFDVFLFPSIFEGFGMAALEAQSCGVPCICSDTLPSLLDVTHTNLRLSLQRNASEWAKKMQTFPPVNKLEMNEMVRNSDFNIDTQLTKLIKLLEN